ncbi:MAG TPA: ribosome silencing factor [Clostridiales bacterium]|nr:ribosome silencing factor [Clostridiales bacterium]
MSKISVLEIAAKALNDKKATDLYAVKISDLTIIADYFLLATATSTTHVRALVNAVEEALEKVGIQPHHVEGKATGWILLDYGDTVIHVFTKEAREYYQLERLWNDGEKIDLAKILETAQEAE